MSKVNYDLDIDMMSLEDFSYFMDCVDEVAIEDGRTKDELCNNQDLHIEWYWDKSCERYHFGNQKLGKTLRGLQNIDVYEVSDSGQVNYFATYESRLHMSMNLDKIYKLHSAFAFCPEKGLGYVIHGNVQECKDHIKTLEFLYQSDDDKEVVQ